MPVPANFQLYRAGNSNNRQKTKDLGAACQTEDVNAIRQGWPEFAKDLLDNGNQM